jgi:hypothetical protein
MWLLDTPNRSAARVMRLSSATAMVAGVAGFHLPYPLDMDIVFAILWINHRRVARFLPELRDQGVDDGSSNNR